MILSSINKQLGKSMFKNISIIIGTVIAGIASSFVYAQSSTETKLFCNNADSRLNALVENQIPPEQSANSIDQITDYSTNYNENNDLCTVNIEYEIHSGLFSEQLIDTQGNGINSEEKAVSFVNKNKDVLKRSLSKQSEQFKPTPNYNAIVSINYTFNNDKYPDISFTYD